MKNLKTLILSLVMAITLSACNAANEIPTPPAITPTPIVTEIPTEQPVSESTTVMKSDDNTTVTTSKNENIRTNETAAEYNEEIYIGNKNSKKFHRPDCRTLPSEKNRVEFSSRERAVNAGYSPCGNCEP